VEVINDDHQIATYENESLNNVFSDSPDADGLSVDDNEN
jgi:hypothetical protein